MPRVINVSCKDQHPTIKLVLLETKISPAAIVALGGGRGEGAAKILSSISLYILTKTVFSFGRLFQTKVQYIKYF